MRMQLESILLQKRVSRCPNLLRRCLEIQWGLEEGMSKLYMSGLPNWRVCFRLKLAPWFLQLLQQQQIKVVTLCSQERSEMVCLLRNGPSCTGQLVQLQSGLQKQNVLHPWHRQNILWCKPSERRKIERLEIQMQRTSWRRSFHPVFKLFKIRPIDFCCCTWNKLMPSWRP